MSDDAKRYRPERPQQPGGDDSRMVAAGWPLDDDTTAVVMRFVEQEDRLRLRLVCKDWRRVGRQVVYRVSFRVKEGQGWATVKKRLDVFRGVRELTVHIDWEEGTVDWGADFAAVVAGGRLVALNLG